MFTSRSTPSRSRRARSRGPLALLTAGVLLTGALWGAGSASATTPATADDDVYVHFVDAETAAALGDFDVISADDSTVQILGDAALADELAALGAGVQQSVRYGDLLPTTSPSAQRRAGELYPLPERLADHTYPTYWGGYRTVDGYYQFGADIAEAYPDLVQSVDFGDSWLKTQGRGGHDLIALRITADVADAGPWDNGQDGKPRFLLYGQSHAREVITSELVWRYTVDLLDGYGTDADVTALLDTTEVWIVFQHNPDGVDLVEEALSDPNLRLTAAGDGNPVNASKAWQRKNVNDSLYQGPSTNWNSAHPGVDLNRNFGAGWGGASTSATPSAATYKGTAAFSEPEAAAVRDLTTALFGAYEVGTTNAAPADRQGTHITLHSYSNYVIYPYAYSTAATVPNLEALRCLGFRQSFANNYNTGKAGEILYDNAGNDIDWVYSALGVPSLTWEIGTAQTGGFFPAYSRAADFYALSKPGLDYAAHAAAAPYRTPLGPSVTGVQAERGVQYGQVAISGTASDATLGLNASAAARRPATQAVTAAQVAVAADATAITTTQPLTVTGAGATVSFTGTVRATGDQQIFVRAQSAGGAWGPWAGAFAPQPALTVTTATTSRFIGSNAYLTVTATNHEAVPVSVLFTTAYGTKTFTTVQPGKTASVSLNTRGATVPAGSLTTTVSATVDGQPITQVDTTTYPGFGA